MDLHFAAANRRWKDLLAEVVIVGLRQHLFQRAAVENVNAHAGEATAATAGDPPTLDPLGIHRHQIQLLVGLWLFQEAHNASRVVDSHDAQGPRG